MHDIRPNKSRLKDRPKEKNESDGDWGAAILLLFIIGGFVFLGNMIIDSGSSDSSDSSDSTSTKKYCIYAGCTSPPSGFWAGKSGYCHAHAKQVLEEEKLIDKTKTQGY